MRVLLVNPAGSNVLHTVGVVFPPLGLLCVAAAVREKGHVVAVHDLMVDRRKADMKSHDVVGIHCDTIRLQQAMDLAHQAKQTGARVVMGGPHPCFDSQTVFASGDVDAIVRGEGEHSFVHLLEAWQRGQSASGIKGVLLKEGDRVIDGGPADHIQDLDSLPLPARDLIDLRQYRQAQLEGWPLTSMHTSRGCPFQCRFCASSQLDGATWRARSAEHVLAEMAHLIEDLGYKAIAFLDDNFAGSKKRMLNICAGILRRGWKIRWWCFMRVDTLLRHPDMIPPMAAAGCFSVFIGVESPSAKVLDISGKGIRADQAREAVRILKSNGIQIWASYILGFPSENASDLRATARFARELDTNTAQFTLLTPYPGTLLWEELEDRLLYKSGKAFDAVHATFRHPHMSTFELQFWHLWAYISFYLRNQKSIRGFIRFLQYRKFGLQLLVRARTV